MSSIPRSRWLKLSSIFGLALTTMFCSGENCNSNDPLDVHEAQLEVVLDFNLNPDFQAGDTIRLSRIANGRVADPDACIVDHLHVELGASGIFIDGEGPFSDPNPGQCGFGGVYETD